MSRLNVLIVKIFKTKTTLKYHRYSHQTVLRLYLQYVNCRRSFKNPKRLSDHKRRYHLNTENYICEYCGYHTRS
ncbi:hypothetical protein CVS40_8170 [Lucilia cuprina]|nr:hypothetical protein CVS40_8170 [Lucilia cuprina]